MARVEITLRGVIHRGTGEPDPNKPGEEVTIVGIADITADIPGLANAETGPWPPIITHVPPPAPPVPDK